MNWGYNVEITFIRRIITTYKRNLNEVIPLCIDSIYSLYYIYFSQHNYIIKAQVKATCLDLKTHHQAKNRGS